MIKPCIGCNRKIRSKNGENDCIKRCDAYLIYAKSRGENMKVRYKDMVGNLAKIERMFDPYNGKFTWELQIEDEENKAKTIFSAVEFSEIEFIQSSVRMG